MSCYHYLCQVNKGMLLLLPTLLLCLTAVHKSKLREKCFSWFFKYQMTKKKQEMENEIFRLYIWKKMLATLFINNCFPVIALETLSCGVQSPNLKEIWRYGVFFSNCNHHFIYHFSSCCCFCSCNICCQFRTCYATKYATGWKWAFMLNTAHLLFILVFINVHCPNEISK